jgi:hypothetical protein
MSGWLWLFWIVPLVSDVPVADLDSVSAAVDFVRQASWTITRNGATERDE